MTKTIQDKYRPSRYEPKKKPSEKGHGPCIRGGDHYRNDFPDIKKDKKDSRYPTEKDKKRSFKSSAHQLPADSNPSDYSDSEYESSDTEQSDNHWSSNFTVIKENYAVILTFDNNRCFN